MPIKDMLLPLVGDPSPAAVAAIEKCVAVAHGIGARVSAVGDEVSNTTICVSCHVWTWCGISKEIFPFDENCGNGFTSVHPGFVATPDVPHWLDRHALNRTSRPLLAVQ